MNREHQESAKAFQEPERSDCLKAGVIAIIVACIMAAFPTILAARHILDLTSANVCFGMAVWYIFAVCAIAAGIGFVRRGIVSADRTVKQGV